MAGRLGETPRTSPVPPPLPEVWASSSSWTHRRVRFPWVPLAWRQHLPDAVQYAVCVTEAPATVCTCGMYSIRWGYFQAVCAADLPHLALGSEQHRSLLEQSMHQHQALWKDLSQR